jgi:hypothetical protein
VLERFLGGHTQQEPPNSDQIGSSFGQKFKYELSYSTKSNLFKFQGLSLEFSRIESSNLSKKSF